MKNPLIDARVLEQLACPACLGRLRPTIVSLLCLACGRVYPVVDGIPVLIVERAEKLGEEIPDFML